jgi:hypothetical protein
MERRRIILTFLVIGLVMAACAMLIRLQEVQDLVREGIVLPLYYLAWLLWLFFISIDQNVLWGLGLFALALVVIYGLSAAWIRSPARRKDALPGDPSGRAEDAAPRTYGRVKFWYNRIESLYSQGLKNDYATHEFMRLARGVDELAGGVLARPQVDDATSALKAFLPSPERSLADQPVLAGNWRQRVAARFRRDQPAQAAPVKDPLSGLCNYLEEKLEIEHDDSD